MNALAEKCHTVILASGSLSPIASLCGELGLTGHTHEAEAKPAVAKRPAPDGTNKKDEEPKKPRLQVQPKPLEANHVIDLEKQLLAVSIGHFDDGSPLTMTYTHYNKPDFITKLGGAIASVIEAVPTGGVLVFVPSYALLRKCVKQWNPYTSSRGGWDANNYMDNNGRAIWDRFESSKGKVIVEPTGIQTKFEEARDEYAETIRETGKCILLAVFRGKMSEGISFNDANARAVICVGIPFPMKSMAVKAKIDFNTEQRLLNKRTDLLPGNEWYSQQAYRAIAQALGRCIRHAADYGSVILMDSRHCDDGEPVEGICRAHRQLPKWMRHHVRNLSKRNIGDSFGKSIAGSWGGLRTEMTRFFKQAPIRSQFVLEQQQNQLKQARDRDRAAQERKNNQKTDGWPPTQPTRSTQNDAGDTPTSAPITPTQRTPA
jgi:Fanconi anemia group J protein